MGKRFEQLSEDDIAFIVQQKLFFVATATADSRVNLSPKGMDAFRVLGEQRVAWLNVTGSGNETAAHVQINPRMTIMFCAFEGSPNILRLYGRARVIHKNDAEWDGMFSQFAPLPGARQIFDVHARPGAELLRHGRALLYPMSGTATNWSPGANGKGDEGVRQYWHEKNQLSIDQIPTNIVKGNG